MTTERERELTELVMLLAERVYICSVLLSRCAERKILESVKHQKGDKVKNLRDELNEIRKSNIKNEDVEKVIDLIKHKCRVSAKNGNFRIVIDSRDVLRSKYYDGISASSYYEALNRLKHEPYTLDVAMCEDDVLKHIISWVNN